MSDSATGFLEDDEDLPVAPDLSDGFAVSPEPDLSEERTVPEWLRTPPPGPRVAMMVRVLTGVNERVLDDLPTERPRYTALACVMICTAAIGGISMFFALGEVMGAVSGWFAPLALFWSAFVLCLDRWLVASMSGRGFRAKIATAVFRLFVAMIFGFIIAEPLVLRIFQTAVVAQIRTDRTENIAQLQGQLEACNPASGQQPTTANGMSCIDYRLAVTSVAAQVQTQIDELQNSTQTVQSTVNAESAEVTRRSTIVSEECDGVKVPGVTTGGRGDGPACQQDYQAYQDYKNSHPIAPLEAQITSNYAKITALESQEATSSASQQQQVSGAIKARLALETQVDAPIGLIERLNALSQLSAANTAVAVSAWTLRLFFVVIDCLPVLVKFSSGQTPYDEQASSLVQESMAVYELRRSARLSVAGKRINAEVGAALVDAERLTQLTAFTLRQHSAHLEELESEAIDQEFARRMSGVTDKGVIKDSEPEQPPNPAPSIPGPRQMNGHGIHMAQSGQTTAAG
jgi:Domain of unknown function (DUF4407)